MPRFILLLIILSALQLQAQRKTFTRYDYLHGKLTPLRTCIDVKQYEITLKVEPARKYITGINQISFLSKANFSKLQLDLFSQLQIDSIVYEGRQLRYTRDSNAVLLQTPAIKKNQFKTITVYYSGNPQVAKKAPWDGGFVWEKDKEGKDWVGLACEGLGASMWLPCKDHWSDEPDSMKMHLIVPEGLTGVSNGRYTGEQKVANGFRQFDWKVSNPINPYDITVNVANYAHIHDEYAAKFNDIPNPLTLDYYVLSYNKSKAMQHFMQVKRMMECFERMFGPYPFWDDGYKLVETPYWGMEHQSCVAYGNDYADNRYNFDFIIVHESAHEWFGNSITANDPADMWIHESFTTYAESIYVGYYAGREYAAKYLKEQHANIENKEPMIGPYDVYYHGRTDNDIYYKGAWMLHTLRSVVDNDSIWFATLKKFSTTFKKQNVNTKDVTAFFSKTLRINLDKFFEQYLYNIAIPRFEYNIAVQDEGRLEIRYRWANAIKGFDMPVKVTMTKEEFSTVTPMHAWQIVDPNYFDTADFKIQADRYLIDVKKLDKK